MRKITFLLFLFLLTGCLIQISEVYAQEDPSSLKEGNEVTPDSASLIFSVDPKNNEVNGIFLKEQDTEAQLYKLKGECYRCEFYQGNIEGPFLVTNSRIKPGKKAVLTIYTLHNLMPGKEFDPGPFPPGSRFNVARIKTTVIENQKGSFKLRTY